MELQVSPKSRRLFASSSKDPQRRVLYAASENHRARTRISIHRLVYRMALDSDFRHRQAC